MPELAFDRSSRVIRTARLLLRPLHEGDADALLAVYRQPEVTRHYDLDTMTEPAQARRMLEFFLAHHDRFALLEHDRLIGTCGLMHWEPTSRMASIGYDLAFDRWGRGLMREATAAVLAYGFAVKGLNRVNALSAVDNAPSARLLQALGFEQEAVLRQFAWWKGAFHDMRMFALLRDTLHTTPVAPLLAAFG